MKTKAAFICVHNSCRSQMAEAPGNLLYGDKLECYSAGTELKPQINRDAVRLIKELYEIDMDAAGHHSKLIDGIPRPDIAISMGCDVGCPFTGRAFDADRELPDPTGKPCLPVLPKLQTSGAAADLNGRVLTGTPRA